jgi:tight adherence protein B
MPSIGTLAAALCGVIVAAGMLLAADGASRRVRAARDTPALSAATVRRIGIAIAAGAVVWLASGWPVAGCYTVVGVLVLPRLLSAGRSSRDRIERTEAIGTWTESVRDSLAEATGIEQAVIAASQRPPAAIADDVATLMVALQRRRLPLGDALAGFQQQLADPIADLVIAQLRIAADAPTGRLAATLSQIAAMARNHVMLRLDIEADRAPIRTELRLIVAITLALVGGLRLLRPQFLAPYHAATGQLVLAVVGGLFTAGMALMASLSRGAEPPRLFTSVPATPAQAQATS